MACRLDYSGIKKPQKISNIAANLHEHRGSQTASRTWYMLKIKNRLFKAGHTKRLPRPAFDLQNGLTSRKKPPLQPTG